MRDFEIRYDGVWYRVYERGVFLERFSTARQALESFPGAWFVLTNYPARLDADPQDATSVADRAELTMGA